MWDLYVLPNFGELVVLKNYFYLELYTLFFVGIIVYLAIKKQKLIELFFVGISVILYKFVTINLFGWSCCTLQTNYFPTLGELNILIWVLTFWNILGWVLLENRSKKKYSIIWVIAVAYIFSIINELVIQKLWLRIYSNEITSLMTWQQLFWMNLETFIYIFVGVIFMTSIYRYLHVAFGEGAVKKDNASVWKLYLYSCIWVLLAEILLHPELDYSGFPESTYLYQDINILVILILGTFIFLSMYGIDTILKKNNSTLEWYKRWVLYVSISTVLYIAFYAILSSLGFFHFAIEWLMWWIQIAWLPVEFIACIIVINSFTMMFVRNYAK